MTTIQTVLYKQPMLPVQKIIFLYLVLLFTTANVTAQTATLTGRVFSPDKKPLENVSITAHNKGTTTNSKGQYTLIVPADTLIRVTFSHISFQKLKKKIKIPKGKTMLFSPRLSEKTEEIQEVTVKSRKNEATGIDAIDTQDIKKLPTANTSIESALKNIGLGVSSSNELSTQYNVRGGNYDENLIYVNGIEVYRPFLVRSGQQEGLSFVNPDLTYDVKFSSGGFQAKYGDKMSSVLDITYKKPKAFAVGITAGLLGGSAYLENLSLNNKLSSMIGIRYRNNSLFIKKTDTETNVKPNFTDVQTYFSYEFSDKFQLDLLTNFSLNKYNYEPKSRITKFGTFTNPKALVVNYNGREKDQYLTIFGALQANYKASESLALQLTASKYNTQEEEYYDILAFYGLGEVNTDFGNTNFGGVNLTQAIGSQLDHARNDLDALIANIQLKATYKQGKQVIETGVKVQQENIKDRIIEWQVIDSAGFSLRPPHLLPQNDEPYTLYTGPLVPFDGRRGFNKTNITRLMGFLQYSNSIFIGEHQLWYNAGVRAQYWQISQSDGQSVISPRGQIAIKPDWKKDMVFRLSGGLYYQPPFYKELRSREGTVIPSVKAQQSFHLVLGNNYSFTINGRPFKLVSEAYYKWLNNVNPFTVNNVQIRYAAKNNAKAYAFGFDMRLNGELVEGTESHLSFSYLNTKENINGQGFIPRPTDQRLKFAVFVQDYVPNYPQFKVYLNTIYNTGVPGGSPSYANPYLFQNRLKDYFRTDIGFWYVFKDAENNSNKHWLRKFKDFSIGLELFNLFDVKNSITNTWVRDIANNQSVGVPNYMSGRLLNVKINVRF